VIGGTNASKPDDRGKPVKEKPDNGPGKDHT
jgi:hypothetical protein